MTPKQQERIRNKIKKVKAALAADKKRWGGQYHDGNGLRYYPPQLYIQLNDFSGGLRYFNWFNKNFSDDSGYPDFLFEWTIILFKTGRLKDAEKKVFETFRSNTHVFNIFFGRHVTKNEELEDSNLQTQNSADKHLCYNSKQDNLADFSEWLGNFIRTENFILLSNKYLDIQKRLKTEHDTEIRHYLIQQRLLIENEL
jgi:hypothetical protein